MISHHPPLVESLRVESSLALRLEYHTGFGLTATFRSDTHVDNDPRHQISREFYLLAVKNAGAANTSLLQRPAQGNVAANPISRRTPTWLRAVTRTKALLAGLLHPKRVSC